MSRDVLRFAPETTVGEAARLLEERGVSGAPVVDGSGRVQGVVSLNDLVREHLKRRTVGEVGTFFTDIEDYRDIGQLPADWARIPLEKLMSRSVLSVETTTSAGTAARILRERGVHRLLVLKDGALAGIVSSLDLLRVLEDAGA
jgi:CBS domain-containing protein